jgi:hypothetical protein
MLVVFSTKLGPTLHCWTFLKSYTHYMLSMRKYNNNNNGKKGTYAFCNQCLKESIFFSCREQPKPNRIIIAFITLIKSKGRTVIN